MVGIKEVTATGEFVKKNAALIIGIAFVVGPLIFLAIDWHYSNQIDLADREIELARQRIQEVEQKNASLLIELQHLRDQKDQFKNIALQPTSSEITNESIDWNKIKSEK